MGSLAQKQVAAPWGRRYAYADCIPLQHVPGKARIHNKSTPAGFSSPSAEL